MLNALLAWPDHPYGFGTLYGSEFNPETKAAETFVIAETVDLDEDETYRERASADRRGQSPARPRPQVPSICRLHQQTRRNRTAGTAVSRRGNTGSGASGQRTHSQAGSLVPRATAAWDRRRNLPSQDGRDRTRPAGLSDHPVSRNWLLAAHIASVQPALVAYRTEDAPWR